MDKRLLEIGIKVIPGSKTRRCEGKCLLGDSGGPGGDWSFLVTKSSLANVCFQDESSVQRLWLELRYIWVRPSLGNTGEYLATYIYVSQTLRMHTCPSVALDQLGWFGVAKSELEISKHLCCMIVRDSWVDPREYNIKVHQLSLKDFDPLRVREFWKSPHAK